MKKRSTRRNFLAASAGLVAASAVPSIVFAQAGATFRIGSLCPITGGGSPYGSGMQKVMEIALAEVNSAGGVSGHKLALFSEDSQTQPMAAVLAAKKLIEVNKVQAILGTWSSGETLAVMPLTDAAGIIEMNVSAAMAISTLDTKDLVWRFQATTDRIGGSFAKVAEKSGFKRPATMALNNPSGLGNMEGFRKLWTKNGGKVVASVVYEPNQPSYRTEVQQVLSQKPDVIVTGSYLPDSTIILREWYQTGQDVKWIMPGWAANSDLVKALGNDVVEGVIAVDSVLNENAPSYNNLDVAFQKAMGKPISSNIYAAMSYDMVICLALAIEAAGPNATTVQVNAKIREVSNPPGSKVYSFAEGKKLLAQKKKINYEGASSVLDFDQYGDVAPDFGMSIIEKGQFVRKWTFPV